jgi:hypothetical protein
MSVHAAADSRPLRERLVGSWRLVSYEVRDGAGALVGHPLGTDAVGYLVYTVDGFMSVQLMRPGRTRYQAGGLGDGTDAESAEAARGYVAYAGPYHVEGDSIVVHEPEVSLFPNWLHVPAAREVALVEPHLELTNPETLPYGGRELTAVLRWERFESTGSVT